ncbi:GAF domain-containing protein [Streptomyces sp. WMMB 322]|uniref:helix-turn-helix domain-containing protein n=1 Tax=Streptomyces sp. WMMB 322 TaxID=1286821 RepID=UPI0006E1D32A|nr:GAF domain-containing protein [Streptomyces sp. WMMB 322]SCK05618.1 PucR C-terminal helix-turn-helix domain-containing protein [Streptomyces sp. WMMB 322]
MPEARSSDAAYLELLSRRAPVEAYDEPLARAREAGAPAAELAALENGKLLALRIRAELEGRRRREAELTALIETVHDLAGLRDLDDVLRAIVQRARSLLGTEVAYMSLTDHERGDTYMRVTEGSVSARFQQVRLGMGEGLGGLVAQTARPYVTDNYPTDERFRHTGPIDAAVGEEGLIAILGVPLLLGGRDVIGVLYAADRRARVFEREQIALLGSFAAHAAVAIDNARLLSETRDAMAELESANETIERASDVHDRLTELVLRGGDVTDVAAAVSEVLEGRVEFVEPSAASAHPSVERSRSAGHAMRDGDTWVTAVTAGGELLGALVLHGHPLLDPVDQRTFERAAMVTSLLLLARRSAGEAEQRVRGELLDDLLDSTRHDPRLLRDRAARLHADLDTPHVLLSARLEGPTGGPSGGHSEKSSEGPSGGPSAGASGRVGPAEREESLGRQRLWAAASHLAATRHGLAAARDGGIVLLLPLRADGTPSRTAGEIAAELGHSAGAPVTVGASAPVAAPAAESGAVAAAYPEARRCVDALRLLGRTGEGAAAEDFGFIGMLLTDSRDVGSFVRRTLGPVLDYDARRGTDLVATMDAYFACGMSPARAKDELHVHVNTVAQRLERVARLLGDDWQSPERALETQLALRLHRLAGAVGG